MEYLWEVLQVLVFLVSGAGTILWTRQQSHEAETQRGELRARLDTTRGELADATSRIARLEEAADWEQRIAAKVAEMMEGDDDETP